MLPVAFMSRPVAAHFATFTVPYHARLCLDGFALLLLLHLEQQRAINVWQDTSKGDSGTDERVEFLVSTDGELEMTRRNTLDFQILGCIARKLEYFSGQVFKYGGKVDGGLCADTRLLASDGSKVALYATARELLKGAKSARCCDRDVQTLGRSMMRLELDGARSWAMTHLKTSFGRVRLGCFGVRVTLSTCLATSFSYSRNQLGLSLSTGSCGTARTFTAGHVCYLFGVGKRWCCSDGSARP